MPLGSGATGVVVSAFDPDLDRKLALKILHGDFQNETTRRRLFREAQALARVDHPNVVEVFHVGSEAGRVFIATEFIEGMSLWRWVRKTPRTPEQIVDAFVAAGRGLAAAHEAGIVHRDFKPANALIARDGRVVVIDFGIAHALDPKEWSDLTDLSPGEAPSTSSALTHTMGRAGTPSYMAPEQFAGEATDARADQFSFCVALWDSLYGMRPFAGDSAETIGRSVLSGKVRPPPRDTEVPSAYERLLRRGLAVDPDRRYRSMTQLLDALEQVRRRRPTWQILGSAALVLGGMGVVSVAWPTQESDESCGTAVDKMDEVWSPSRSAEFGSTSAQTARLAEVLDEYAQSWRQAHTESCSAAAAVDAQTFAARTRCLDERLAAFDELVSMVREPDAPHWARAVDAAVGLPPASACLDMDREPAAAPVTQAGEARIRTVRAALRRARARRSAGDYTSALAILDEVDELARAGDDPALPGRVALERGSNEMGMARNEAAVASLELAFERAVDAEDDLTAADAAVQLMPLYADELHDFERGLQWGRQAEVLFARTKRPDRFYLFYNYALIHWRAGSIERAFEYQKLAEESLRSPMHSVGHEAKVHQLAGLLHARQGHFDLATAELEKALRLESEHVGANHPVVATTHNNLAAILGQTQNAAEAEYHLHRAVEIWDAAGEPFVALAGTAYNNLGAMQSQRGKFSEAERSYRKALERMAETLPEHDVAFARPRGNLATIMAIRGDHKQAEQLLRSAHDRLQDVLGPKDSHTLIMRRSLGAMLCETGRSEEGLALLEEVVTARQQEGDDGDPGDLVRALTTWAQALIRDGQTARAFEAVRQARRVQEDLAEHGVRQAQLAATFATVLLLEGDVERATGVANEYELHAQQLRWHEAGRNALMLARAWRHVDRPDRATAVLDAAQARLPEGPIGDHWRQRIAAAR